MSIYLYDNNSHKHIYTQCGLDGLRFFAGHVDVSSIAFERSQTGFHYLFRDVCLLTVAKHIWDRGNTYMLTEEVEKDIRKAILQLDRGRKETKFREGAWKKEPYRYIALYFAF